MTSLLPSNAHDFELGLEDVLACRLEALSAPCRLLWDGRKCPERLLPWLAYSVGVERWPEGYTEEQKRKAIASSIEVHRRRGTLAALQSILTVEGMECQIGEGVRGPYTFAVDFIRSDKPSEDLRSEIDALISAVKVAKNERSDLVSVALHHSLDIGARVGVSLALESWSYVLFDTWLDTASAQHRSGALSLIAQSGRESEILEIETT